MCRNFRIFFPLLIILILFGSSAVWLLGKVWGNIADRPENDVAKKIDVPEMMLDNYKNVELKKDPPVEGVKGWALGCAAVIFERNHDGHNTLAGIPLTQVDIKDKKELLSRCWGIKNRKDLLSRIQGLETGNYRESFAKWGKMISQMSEEQWEAFKQPSKQDKATLQQLEISRNYYREFGPKSLIGWDFCRVINLCRFGYGAGYLSEEEAWEKIMPTARLLQDTFASWEEMGRNYIIGRVVELGDSEKLHKECLRREDAMQRLLDMPTSPWRRYRWDMDLTDPNYPKRPREKAEPQLTF